MFMKKIIIGLIVLCLFTGCGSKNDSKDSTPNNHNISAEEVFQEIESEESHLYIIDVRTLSEYNSGHIKTAVNVPLDKIDTISDYVPSKKDKVVVYCQSGSRSKQAFNELIELGYSNVFDLGGIQDWNYEIVR